MARKATKEAHFKRVSEAGELVFSYDGGEFAIAVDEALERAVLEARQVGREHQTSIEKPPQQATVPISQIQSLIRAGADPANVAERYGVSDALVRRFSSAVETEKQYAIEQFLSTPAPRDSKAHTISDLVERMLAAANVDMESVNWRATRRGIEPWRIEAQFNSDGHQIKADWTWNMHDNAIECLNNAARKLMGEQPHGSSHSASTPVQQPTLPGDSVRSARIERVVSAWNKPVTEETASAGATAPAAQAEEAPAELDLGLDDAPAGIAEPEVKTAEIARQDDEAKTAEIAEVTENQPAAEPVQPAQPVETKPAKQPAKRRTTRSAVPSWDEILFGD